MGRGGFTGIPCARVVAGQAKRHERAVVTKTRATVRKVGEYALGAGLSGRAGQGTVDTAERCPATDRSQR